MTIQGDNNGTAHDQRFAYPGRQEHFVKHGGHKTEGDFVLKNDYVVVDVETSGLEPKKGARVIEFAAIRINPSGEVVDSFHTLVNPTDGNVGMTSIHGVTLAMVKNAPTFADVTARVNEIFDDAIFVAHHALFDERFVAHELDVAGVAVNTMPGLCTYWLSRQVNEKTDEFPNHKLETLTRRYKVDPGVAHSAYSDAMVVAQVLPLMLEQFGDHRHHVGTTSQEVQQFNNDVLLPRTLSLFD